MRLNDPTGPLADASVMAMGNAYFRVGRFEEAASNYDVLRKEYPNSKYQALAHVLGLQAKMRVYQGTLYDQAPLNDANKIADQALKQFEKELGPEHKRMVQARTQIIEEKASREFMLAEYYEQHKYYGAAKMYYKSRDRRLSQHGEGQASAGADGEDPQRARLAAPATSSG